MLKFGSLEEVREFLESMGLDPDKISTGGEMTGWNQDEQYDGKQDG